MAFQISRPRSTGQAVGKWTGNLGSLKKRREQENQSAFGESWDKSDRRGEERYVLCRELGPLLAVCEREASWVEGRETLGYVGKRFQSISMT
jgi:hypothetical protein